MLLPIVFVLTSCGDDSKIKDVVRQKLKDPGSAQFKDTIFSADNNRACIVWNAKNSMGGYGDWDVAELKKGNTEWIVKELKGSKYNCSEIGFKALDAGEKAEMGARLKAIEILQKAKNISGKEAAEISSSGICNMLVFHYVYNSKRSAEYRIRQDSEMLENSEKYLKEVVAKLNAGEC